MNVVEQTTTTGLLTRGSFVMTNKNEALHRLLMELGLELSVLQIIYDQQYPYGLSAEPVLDVLRHGAANIVAGVVNEPSEEVKEIFDFILSTPEDDEPIN